MTALGTTSRPRGWPAHEFQARLGAVLLGAAATIGVWTVQVLYAWHALERYYLAHYILASAGWFEKYAETLLARNGKIALLNASRARASSGFQKFHGYRTPHGRCARKNRSRRRAARFRFGSPRPLKGPERSGW